jgi:hypothetical protein
VSNTNTRAILTGLEAGIPVLMTGPPGVGKTAWAKDLEKTQMQGKPVKVLQLIASVREPTDIGGYPVPDMENNVVRMMPVDWSVNAERLVAEGNFVIIFADEIRTVSAPVQAALMKGIHERRVGDHEMPFEVRWLAAANSVDESAGGVPLEPPMANRFQHVAWRLDYKEWCDGMISGTFRPQSPLGESALAALTSERANVAAFIHHRPEMILQVPKTEEDRDGPWLSPRTLDYTAHLWATAGTQDEEFRQELMASCVGFSAAAEYISWRNSMDLPDPEDVLAGKVKKIVNLDRPDITYSILSAAVAAVVADWTPERYIQGWKVLGQAAKESAGDVAAAVLRALEGTREGRKNVPDPSEHVAPFLDLLKRAGIQLA